MAKKIAILNFKGGVGKTTTAINLGKALHLLGLRVWVIDLDSQANASQIMGYNAGDGDTVFDALVSRKGDTMIPIYEHDPNFDFTPSDPRLGDIDEAMVGRFKREEILRRLIAPFEGEYDYVLMDCPPNRGILTVNAMAAADEVIVPLDGEILSMQGMGEITAKLEEVKSVLNPAIEVRGYLMTTFNSRLRLHKTVAGVMEDNYPGKVFHTRIRQCVALSESPAKRQNIYEYAPESAGADDYRRLATELTGKNYPRHRATTNN
jgi:chromosome partitioning protein